MCDHSIEYHTPSDWLMPAMAAFHTQWAEAKLDIMSSLQADPVGLLHQDRAVAAIASGVDADEASVAAPCPCEPSRVTSTEVMSRASASAPKG
jgi:DNA-binding transcriptional LysR family regulator